MSDKPSAYAFPQRAPVFTAFVVIVGILLFGVFIRKVYHAAPPVDPRGNVNPADIAEDQRWKYSDKGRAAVLTKLRQDAADANSYGWLDKRTNVVRLPIDRAIELTVSEHAQK